MADKRPQPAVKIADPAITVAAAAEAAVLNTDPSASTYGLVAQGDVKARLATDYVVNGTTSLIPQFQKFELSGSATATVANGQTNKKTRILQLSLVTSTSSGFHFKDSNGTNIFGSTTHRLGVTGQFNLLFSPLGWMESGLGFDVQINNNTTGTIIAGTCVYVLV